ncbi:MAG: signal peptidase II [Nocardioides sp.]
MQAARGTSLNADDAGGRVAASSSLPKRRRALFLVVAATAYAIDVISKIAAVRTLNAGREVEVAGPVLTLRLVYNPGAAFSIGTNFTVALTFLAIGATCVVAVVGWRTRTRVWAWGLGLLLAGVLGNLTDRLVRQPGPFRGHVVDFLALPKWPVFNVADVCINVAAGVIVVQAWRGVRVDGARELRDPGPGGRAPADPRESA